MAADVNRICVCSYEKNSYEIIEKSGCSIVHCWFSLFYMGMTKSLSLSLSLSFSLTLSLSLSLLSLSLSLYLSLATNSLFPCNGKPFSI